MGSSQLRIVVIDNYDSFVFNLVQYIGATGAEPTVVRNDVVEAGDIWAMNPDGVLISPGPGRPEDAGIANDLLRSAPPTTPVFGVCLGHQCIGQVFGGNVVRASQLMHGKTSQVTHDGQGVFSGVPSPLRVTRYHSLVIDPAVLPEELEVSATTDDGTIMGVRHRSKPIEGVQFHPESVLTEHGHQIVNNWLATTAQFSQLTQ